MNQLIQNFKTGDLYVGNVPPPALKYEGVLVKNHFSLISAGTERSTVATAQANLVGKAQQRPDLVKQVFDSVKKEGLKSTYEKVMTKLDSLKTLGYSSAGVVIQSNCKEFQIGERVACAGQDYASHAEVIFTPKNLVAKIPDNVSFEEAAFTTVAAIAMQGVRQADVRLGENIVVIGLGLIGQITVQLLKAAGCNVIGLDINPTLLENAKTLSNCDFTGISNGDSLNLVSNVTNGIGADSVIITAATKSSEPIQNAIQMTRKKGTVVVVGTVGMDIPRSPFYEKELSLKISCSYGPGRYDSNYEEQGKDYPVAYVRWTENRNMQSYLNLVGNGKLNIKNLITHTFDIGKAVEAYEFVLGKKEEFFLGILLRYTPKDSYEKTIKININPNPSKNNLNIGFIGAGSFAQKLLLPFVKEFGVNLNNVCTATGVGAKSAADKFGFRNCTTSPEELFNSKDVDTIFVATRHNMHAKYVIEGLKVNKNIFVEKPLCLTIEEMEEITELYSKSSSTLLVGFNRRFSPLLVAMKDFFININEPIIVNYRVNAGFLPKEHWTQDPVEGGGRILGEVCHFIDCIQYLTGSSISYVFADMIESSNSEITNEDNVNIIVKMKNGSLGIITYLANGDKSIPKEKIEVTGGNQTASLNDFFYAELTKSGKSKKIKSSGKGHKEEVISFLTALKNGNPTPISFDSILETTKASFLVIESLKTKQIMTL